MDDLPPGFAERIYAGVLGKVIGVCLGRPFEGWDRARIARELGEIRAYVNDHLPPPYDRTPVAVTDDDIAGTFVLARALAEHGDPRLLTAEAIGRTWLNQLVEGRSTIWWGGLGSSTEHTAWLRLKAGIAPPRSGSAALNGRVLAEQIGGRIFVEGWALASPGNPAQAAHLAGMAASVSHDGLAVEAARLIAAMQAQAFVEQELGALLETGLSFVPPDSPLRRMVEHLRAWHARDGDWRATHDRIAAEYGGSRFGGICHVVPNQAMVILALLYGEGFDDALSIACMAGWDTDCNAGTVGCLAGLRFGLAAIGPAWRDPIADRLYLSAAEGGGALSDAVIESRALIRAAHALGGQPPPPPPKGGARFGFEFPGSTQGFRAGGGVRLANPDGHALELRLDGEWGRVTTATFPEPAAFAWPPYALLACPTLYPGQHVEMRLRADAGNSAGIQCRACWSVFGAGDRVATQHGPEIRLAPGEEGRLAWCMPDAGGAPIAEVGLDLRGPPDSVVRLDRLGWHGAPEMVLRRPEGGVMWHRAWMNAADHFSHWWEAFRLSQDRGTGLVAQGTMEWRDYEVAATLTPHLARGWGLLARVGGMRRWVGVLFQGEGPAGDRLRLVRMRDSPAILAECTFPWEAGQAYTVRLRAVGPALRVWVGDRPMLATEDAGPAALESGGIGLLVEEGTLATEAVAVRAVPGFEEA